MFNYCDSIPLPGLPMRILPFATLLLCGCYVNVPLASVAPDPGERLHVELTDQGSIDLARYLGRNVASVDGRLLGATDSVLSLSVAQVATRSGDEQFWKGEQVALPRPAVATVQRRKLSLWRSGLIAGALVAVTAVLGSQVGGSSGGGKGVRPPPVGQ